MSKFGDLSSVEGLEKLNNHFLTNSYISGTILTRRGNPTSADVDVFNAITAGPYRFVNVARWYAHMLYMKRDFNSFPQAENTANDEDDDIDLFGSDDEIDEEAEKVKAQRLAEYQSKKAAKPKPIAKSLVTLDVKPWDDETDMKALEASVRSIERDGLLWGLSKLVPIGYGISKLQMTLVVEDDKVSIDELQEAIENFDEYVQSTDVVAMAKL